MYYLFALQNDGDMLAKACDGTMALGDAVELVNKYGWPYMIVTLTRCEHVQIATLIDAARIVLRSG